ncbi:hypothetical protein CK203_070286 [Vitis vinifera]|uniref:Uncharacterized protein n=1 Tax=Vitis vinifera TaxID=29760 RepID=A0A438E6D6_VITVI|nr:hypothetical protein CK203_070286 [Vitis vinifera]
MEEAMRRLNGLTQTPESDPREASSDHQKKCNSSATNNAAASAATTTTTNKRCLRDGGGTGATMRYRGVSGGHGSLCC